MIATLIRHLRLVACLAAAAAPAGCGALATWPAWAGGGLAVTGPIGLPDEDAEPEPEGSAKPGEPEEVGARHILVQHVESKRLSEGITRTREAARARAQECLLKLREGADFTEMVAEYTDEPGGAERGGDLGLFPRGVMVESFTEAAFALKVGEISEVIETPFGFHIIKRTR